jgi:hypothetical protein
MVQSEVANSYQTLEYRATNFLAPSHWCTVLNEYSLQALLRPPPRATNSAFGAERLRKTPGFLGVGGRIRCMSAQRPLVTRAAPLLNHVVT